MHLSNHAFISAFLRQYFFVDTNSHSVLKTFMLKKRKKTNIAAFHPSQVCPGYSRRHISLFADLTGLPLTCFVCLTKLASANPFIYSVICVPSSVNAKPLFQQLQEST